MTDWEINVFTQCNELLERHISVGSELLKQIKTKASELKTSNEFNKIKIKRIQQYIKEFSDHCDEGNLLNLVKATVNIESFSNSAQPALNGAVIQFCHSCKEKVKKRKYKFEEFEKDLENFKQKSASKAMQDNMSTEISSYVEQLKGDIIKKFQTLISCIQLDAEEVAFADKFQLDIGELPGVNVGGYGTSVRQKAQSHRRWLWGVAGVAGAAGAGISGGFLWATLSTAVAVVFPPAAIAAPLVVGLAGTAWFGIKAWTTYDGDCELRYCYNIIMCKVFT
jgi:hemerythrin-like domain-containing protein